MNFEKLSALVALATIGSFLLDAVIAIYRLCKKSQYVPEGTEGGAFYLRKTLEPELCAPGSDNITVPPAPRV